MLAINRTDIGIVWTSMDGKGHKQRIYSGTNKEAFDAELYGTDKALDIVHRAGKLRARNISISLQPALAKLKEVIIWADS